MDFRALLDLIDDRSAAFRAAVDSAPGLAAPVPSCPGWTLADLARHLGEGRRKWAAIVAGDPAPDEHPPAADPLAWLDESNRLFKDALLAAGPDRRCWTWWERSASPQTSGAVARHQLQEVAVHTYDAQLTAGAPQPLPTAVALDGVDEFLATCCAGEYSWPHRPVALDYRAAEGRSWRLGLAADGVTLARDPAGPADATARGSASDLVLALYCRIPMDALVLEGDGGQFDRLIAWDPDE
ncbi:maleylpyruvate isomerase family mycothiol-dependent enzyme [Dactylosporangium vinaceum]|uniref:Maleylpyruvate isomerase family mycothiol-dependent enzyme n=1 Tax=Dactylosporangium vinaceum TaxID=53362 RepID=A0ABV5MI62_9ACTN|nr:maleylpyruvate isomerase family mycothiol-dependent enzyme [Dactylosporangium vinaceum]UAB97527.1 maleylpyruvate isomerase family mycothiol-dependent enzyme [Dactylosporangium vinaceum]